MVKGWLTHTRLRRAGKEFEQEHARLDKELQTQNAHFIKAVEDLEIHIHPVLQDLTADIFEIECTRFERSDPPVNQPDPPDIRSWLNSSQCLTLVPEWIHPLIEERAVG